jgi:ketosteroid isomerase-like protein
MRIGLLTIELLLIACAPLSARRGDATVSEQEILRLEQAWRDARVARDTAFLQSFYAKELRIQGANGVVIGREQDIAGFASGAIRPEFIRAEEMHVTLYGDVAVVTGRDHLKGTYGRTEGEGCVRFMHILAHRDGRWQLVASQGTWVQGKLGTPSVQCDPAAG